MAVEPKILCSHCGSELKWRAESCPSCGVVIKWPDRSITANLEIPLLSSKNDMQKNKSQRTIVSSMWSSKSIVGIILVIAVAVLMYELIREKRSSTESIQEASIQRMQPIKSNVETIAEIQTLENRVAMNPNDMALTLQLANVLQDNFTYEKAIRYYKAYLVNNPSDADARVDMGVCYKELGSLSEAKEAMKRALQDVPNHLNAHFNLGIVSLTEGNVQESNEWFKKTVALDPTGEVGKRAQQLLTQHSSQVLKTK